MTRWRHLLVGLAAAAWAAATAAADVELAPSPYLDCLQPAAPDRGAPEYPFEAWKAKQAGHVQVELDFTAADAGPDVRFVDFAGGVEFTQSVMRHVRGWRLPCLPPGARATLIQRFDFAPDRRQANYGPPVDAADARRREALKCLSHVSGVLAPGYPRVLERAGVKGRIYLSVWFRAPDQPPEVTPFALDWLEPLQRHSVEWAKGLRLPCLAPGDEVGTGIPLEYLFKGDRRDGLRPATLPQLLAGAKRAPEARLSLNTHDMGCPFDVRWTYLQPKSRNRVGVLGPWRAGREPVLELLAALELDLTGRQLDAAYADATTITVPCLRLGPEAGRGTS